MRRHSLVLLLAVGTLLLTPGAVGAPLVPGDPTPPVVTPIITGTLGSNGWYVSAVTINWSVVDPESIILETIGCDSRTLTTDTLATLLSCYARSDGGETTVTITIRIDRTGPVVTAAPSRSPDSNGWYNHALSVGFTGTDATSGLESCVGAQTYSGPDNGNASVSGSCRDRAGNTTVRVFGLSYDATAPAVTGASPSRPPDSNGWYNHALTIAFSGADATSGIDSCTQATYSGPDNQNVSVPGSCRDRAGNQSATSTFGLSYDATAPAVTGASASRPPDSSGWYNHALGVTFTGADAMSGIGSCTQASYSGPDDETASVSGTCRDRAGNVSASSSFGFSYDATGPVVTATPSRSPDSNGWYNHALSVGFTGIDPISGVDSCVPTQNYSGPDGQGRTVNGSCRDEAGNTTPRTFTLNYDATGPVVTATPSRGPDSNGWYNHALSVAFTATDVTSGFQSCVPAQNYSGPDGAGRTVNGSCLDRAGNTTARTFTLDYDATAPQVSGATTSRAPDSNGWYNHALTITFAGTDATSGIFTCTQADYSGPDSANASVSGTCRDRAGNLSAASSFGFSYDATGPVVTATPSRNPDSNGWYNHALTVAFTGIDPVSGVDSCVPTQNYSGPDGQGRTVNGSCRDEAGNTTPRTFTLNYDATGPVVTATPSRSPDSNGWYNHALSVAFTATDVTSGFESCVPAQNYSGPDGEDRTVTGSCRDRAGNTTARTFTLDYDATGPVVTATPSRNADSNGWYNHALTVTFVGTDATSGVDSCVPPQTYSGPDGAGRTVNGSCLDEAGNTTPRTFTLDYDATGPVVTATPSRGPDANGWYNHALSVVFTATDVTSGFESCVAPQTYSGPDNQNASVSGSCRDRAANTTVRVFGLSYDATAPQVTGASPSRSPDSNGWYNHALTVSFAGTDATSGIDSCTEAIYSGPDNANASVNGSCRDRADNQSATSSFALSYDATAPVVTDATPVRPPDRGAWYNHAVAIAFEGTDATSGIDSCPPAVYEGPDGREATVEGACRDVAGNLGTSSFPLNYDETPPHVTATPVRASDANGWYNHPLGVTFVGSDATSGVESCTGVQTYHGPESTSAALVGSCLDQAGNTAAASFAFGYDATAPTVAGATPSREPDANGWYDHALTIRFHGSDATAGIDGCTVTDYAGPDDPAASVSGFCADRAGNQSGSIGFPLRYDATDPSVALLTVKPGKGSAELSWLASADTQLVELTRSPGVAGAAQSVVYRGTGTVRVDRGLIPGRKYRYTLTAYDEAQNGGERTLDFVARGALINPAPGARVTRPPLLSWAPVRGASYYNVLLVLRGRRVFSAWPLRPRLQLGRSWTYRGRRHRLRPGLYRWYVFPGHGRLAAGRFGRLLGGSTFVVTG